MIYLEPVDESSPHLSDVLALYRSAFPANERRSLNGLLRDKSGRGEVLAALDGDTFVGLIILLTSGDVTHILYFAVQAELRDRGYGSAILEATRQRHPKQRILADVEDPEVAKDRIQRERRIAFYLRNGFAETEIRYRWSGENYLILAAGGQVTEDEFWDFWETIYSRQSPKE